jgi:hypothetical protein
MQFCRPDSRTTDRAGATIESVISTLRVIGGAMFFVISVLSKKGGDRFIFFCKTGAVWTILRPAIPEGE